MCLFGYSGDPDDGMEGRGIVGSFDIGQQRRKPRLYPRLSQSPP